MSLRLIPYTPSPLSTNASYGAPSAPGVHDTLRANLALTTPAPKSLQQQSNDTNLNITSSHPLEARLTQWRAQQDSLKMNLLRRQFGIAEPVRRGMELAIVRAGEWRPSCLASGFGGYGGLHEDILAGRDAEIGWEDVFCGGEFGEGGDFHTEMEGRFGMVW